MPLTFPANLFFRSKGQAINWFCFSIMTTYSKNDVRNVMYVKSDLTFGELVTFTYLTLPAAGYLISYVHL